MIIQSVVILKHDFSYKICFIDVQQTDPLRYNIGQDYNNFHAMIIKI